MVKSWHIAFIGTLLQGVFGALLVSGIGEHGFGGIMIGIVGIVVIMGAALGILPLLLLPFDRTRTLGAIFSILLGIFGTSTQFGIIVGPFLIVGGIWALWKRV